MASRTLDFKAADADCQQLVTIFCNDVSFFAFILCVSDKMPLPREVAASKLTQDMSLLGRRVGVPAPARRRLSIFLHIWAV